MFSGKDNIALIFYIRFWGLSAEHSLVEDFLALLDNDWFAYINKSLRISELFTVNCNTVLSNELSCLAV